jgi:sarcosine oxidase subunit gamma
MANRRTPLPDDGWSAGWAAQWLTVLPPAARFVFHGGAGARAPAAPIWGPEFCEEACRAAVQAARATLWLGPDEYLLLDANAASTAGGELEAALAKVPHALIDVSHRQFALELSGPHAATILCAACPLDLDGAEFPVGMCTRTAFAKADIVLWRPHEDTFHLEVWRSFAGYVIGLLTEIAAEFYPHPPRER